jgi:hypothetical protein
MCKALWYYYKCQSEALSHLLVLELLQSEIACKLCLTPHRVSGDGVFSLQSDHHPQNINGGNPTRSLHLYFFLPSELDEELKENPQGFSFFSISTGLRMQISHGTIRFEDFLLLDLLNWKRDTRCYCWSLPPCFLSIYEGHPKP